MVGLPTARRCQPTVMRRGEGRVGGCRGGGSHAARLGAKSHHRPTLPTQRRWGRRVRGLASLVSNPQCTWRRCGLRGIGGGEWVGKIIATASGNCTHPPEPARRGLRGAVLVARGRCRCGGHGARWRRGPERCEILFGGSPMGGGGRRPRAVPTFVRPIGCSNLSQRGESHLPPAYFTQH